MHAAAISDYVLQTGWRFYLETLFSGPQEVHAFQLGLFAGGLAIALVYGGYPRTGGAIFVACLALALGLPNLDSVCHLVHEGCGTHPIQRKPWYFLTGLYGAGVATPVVVGALSSVWRYRPLSS